MTHRPPHDVAIPHCLYSCARDECAERRSYPAEDLYWVPDAGWYCIHCIDDMPEEYGDGISLAQWLAEHRKDDSAYLRDLIQRLMTEVRPYCRPSMVHYDVFPVFKEAVEFCKGRLTQ